MWSSNFQRPHCIGILFSFTRAIFSSFPQEVYASCMFINFSVDVVSD